MRISGVFSFVGWILYGTGYWICEYFHYEDIVKWRELRDFLTGIVIFMLIIINFIPPSRLSKASLCAFIVLCFGNVVDRLVFDITTFVGYDYYLMATSLIVFIIKYTNAKIHRGIISSDN